MENRKILKDIQEPIVLILLYLLGTVGIALSSLYLIYNALIKGKEWLGKSLIYMTIFRYLNPNIFFFDKNITILVSYVILIITFIYAMDFLFSMQNLIKVDIFAFFIYCSLILLFANLTSQWFLLSFIKLLIFIIGFFSTYVCIHSCKNFNWFRFATLLFVAILLLNFLALLLGSAAWFPGGGFKGIFNHSQAAGTILVLLFVSALNYSLFEKEYSTSTYQFTILAAIIQLFMANSRTSVFAFIMASLFILLLNNLLHKIVKFLFTTKGIFIILLSLVMVVSFNEKVTIMTTNFLLKREANLGIDIQSYDFLSNRRILYAKQFINIEKNPYLGIGFGIPTQFKFSEKQYGVSYFPGTNIPMSYPVEKGVLITALWEETGIIGLSLFFIFLFTFSFPFLQKRSLYPHIAYLTALLINFGEFIFFSTNGLGIILWFTILIAKIKLEEKK